MDYIKLKKDGNIAVMTIDRPDKLNALNKQMLHEIHDCLREVHADEDIYVLILTGSDGAFISGADIDEMVEFSPMDAMEWETYGSELTIELENFRVPVIAAINGCAIGGGVEFAMACDMRIASDNAIFCHPEAGLGIVPGFGGSQRLPRIIGAGRAKEMIYTGRIVTAKEAKEFRLVNKVVPKDELMNEAYKIANEICQNAQIAVQQAKKAITKGMEIDKISALAYESQIFALCFSTEDQRIGMKAFVNKDKEKKFINK